MTKAELVDAVAKKTEDSKLTKKQAEAAVKAVIETITETLAKGDSIQLVGFGTFEVRARSKKGYQPAYKEAYQDRGYIGSRFQGRQSA